MGSWLATITFEDGRVLYARYSTVTASVHSELYERVCRPGEVHPDWGRVCDRSEVAGEPLPFDRDAPLAPVDELLPVTVEVEPDGDSWGALYCPRRRLMLGPEGLVRLHELPETYELVPDGDGVRHLRPPTPFLAPDDPPALCGRPVPGEPLPFHYHGWDEAFDVPRVDLYASWSDGTVCRPCLVIALL